MSPKQDSNPEILLHGKNYVIQNYTLKIPKYEFHLVPSALQVEGAFAMLSATVLYEDGSDISTEYFEDIVFALCLEKRENMWKVIYDLSRNDVPSDEEMIEIKKEFPGKFPKKLLPKFWQEKF
jgi:hypothetical protein